ncbi:MAG: hypothetical protein ACRD6U_06910, partial [Nitrososphaeraceae archaeon]
MIESNARKIEFVFPETELRTESKPVKRGPNGQILHSFSTSLDEITNWFHKYEIESIELWITGAIETGGILKLAVST